MEKATTEVAMMGPRAFPVNLAEFRKPMMPPFSSLTKIEKMSGMVAATSPV